MAKRIRSLLPNAANEGGDPGRHVHRIAVIGNALPRRCGLATYTSHVVDALHARFPDLIVDHYAMDDGTGIAYPPAIRTIRADDANAYREAAGLIEASGAEAIWVQHEFGIFGGEAGSHLLTLLDRSTLPVIATLHTVLERPSDAERAVLDRLIARASHLIVMAERGAGILRDIYGVAAKRISVIPHGVPDRDYIDPDSVKARYGLAGRKIVMTFGLLAPDKGVRFMIGALPALVAGHPDATYVMIGATHPNLVREEGEAHRQSLVELAEMLGVADNIRFIDAFLDQDELLDWLEACDVYVTPYLNLAQITSGTLSYAVALGKPVVSTPYLHAVELLGDGTGVLVPPRDAPALADAIGRLLSDEDERRRVAARAYARGRELLWPKAVERAIAAIERLPDAAAALIATAAPSTPLKVDLGAIRRMTDSTGMLQHGIFSVADRNHGYCIDDNARALILTCKVGLDDADVDVLADSYAAFVQHAWNPDRGMFRNFMRYDRGWCEDEGSEDSNGRALWALGYAAANGRNRAMRDWAIHLFDHAAPLAERLGSPRAKAFAALGAAELLQAIPTHARARAILEDAGDLLHSLLVATRRPDWSWFEAVLAYDNARLPEALIRAGEALGRPELTACGLETLDWIIAAQTSAKGSFQPVGTDSFGREYAEPLPFDQQPLEAQATVEACLTAYRATGDARWAEAGGKAYHWFTGANDLGLPLASRNDGGCHDGLMPHGLNRNQGAESILALQLANVAISELFIGKQPVKKSRTAA